MDQSFTLQTGPFIELDSGSESGCRAVIATARLFDNAVDISTVREFYNAAAVAENKGGDVILSMPLDIANEVTDLLISLHKDEVTQPTDVGVDVQCIISIEHKPLLDKLKANLELATKLLETVTYIE